MSVTLLVMTDGRLDCLSRSVTTLARLHGPVTRRVLHDDTGDDDYRALLRNQFPDWEVIGTPRRSGFGKAYRNAYDWLLTYDTNQWVWSTEDDFRVTRDVDLAAIQRVMLGHTNLTQMALRRQPWNDTEKAAGGIVESRPGAYTDCSDQDGNHWLEHRLFHTTNPSMVPRRVLEAHPWPTVPHSEGVFSACLFADPHARAGFWGTRASGEWVDHIGNERAGHGY